MYAGKIGRVSEVTCNPGYTPNVAMLTCFLLGTLPSCKPEPCPVNTTLAVSSLTDTCEGLRFWFAGSEPEPGRQLLLFDDSSDGSNTEQVGESVVSDSIWFQDGSATGSEPPPCQPVQCVCAPGYNSSQGPQMWDCAGPDSVLPAIPGRCLNVRLSRASWSEEPSLPNVRHFAEFCDKGLYNLPFGIQFTHDCDNIKTDETCTVSCADGFSGSSTVLVCEGTRGVAGNINYSDYHRIDSHADDLSGFLHDLD
ncbi:hypothetical protein AK812_SmicGene2827 [Symbiodinium microadriaticum]|uniref:Sushi domain-containing protein n=1 Tax=Symbiodinium microadriaticum TaxID=2951 RepID=A0A1Q9F0K6_SYMMI|nr:hypothetical protein AK812_SmicGene2827 [Symbiodinium microadriaticum]